MIKIPTYTGLFMDIENPDPATICFEDIARSHAGSPRYLCHSVRPYTIGEHCVRVAACVSTMWRTDAAHVIRECLLHDAHEAYLGEIPRMIKNSPMMAEYRRAEERVDKVIRKVFYLNDQMPYEVKAIDRAICRAEIRSGLFLHPWRDDATGVDNGDPRLSKECIAVMATSKFNLLRTWGWDYSTVYNVFVLTWDQGAKLF